MPDIVFSLHIFTELFDEDIFSFHENNLQLFITYITIYIPYTPLLYIFQHLRLQETTFQIWYASRNDSKMVSLIVINIQLQHRILSASVMSLICAIRLHDVWHPIYETQQKHMADILVMRA